VTRNLLAYASKWDVQSLQLVLASDSEKSDCHRNQSINQSMSPAGYTVSQPPRQVDADQKQHLCAAFWAPMKKSELSLSQVARHRGLSHTYAAGGFLFLAILWTKDIAKPGMQSYCGDHAGYHQTSQDIRLEASPTPHSSAPGGRGFNIDSQQELSRDPRGPVQQPPQRARTYWQHVVGWYEKHERVIQFVILAIVLVVLQIQLDRTSADVSAVSATQAQLVQRLNESNFLLSQQLNGQLSQLVSFSRLISEVNVRLELLNVERLEQQVSTLSEAVRNTTALLASKTAEISADLAITMANVTQQRSAANSALSALQLQLTSNFSSTVNSLYGGALANYSTFSSNLSSAIATLNSLGNVSDRLLASEATTIGLRNNVSGTWCSYDGCTNIQTN